MNNSSTLVFESFPAHGGNLKFAERVAGCHSSEIMDFSVNVNPLGPPREISRIWSELEVLLEKYPDPDYEELKADLAQRYKLDADRISVANGSTELIYLLPKIISAGKEVALLAPCFSEYIRAFELGNIGIRFIPLQEHEGFNPSRQGILEFLSASRNIGALVISNPNNPTGRSFTREDLLEILDYCEQQKIFLIVDESYIEFCKSGNSLKQKVGEYRYLVVLRSMTKFYCLPGIRLGFGLFAPDWARTIEKYKPPWSANNLAQKLGSIAINDFEYSKKSREYTQKQQRFISRQLEGIKDIEVFPSDCNFLLFQIRDRSPMTWEKFFYFLLEKKILVRQCGNFEGLNDSFFRVAAMKREHNLILIDVIKEFFDSEIPCDVVG